MFPSPKGSRQKSSLVLLRVELDKLRRSPLRLAGVIGGGALAALFLFVVLWAFRSSPHTGLPGSMAPEHAATLAQATRELAAGLSTHPPAQSVAFAIPVGGRTERSESLGRIIDNLLQGGAPPQNIFIFEDVEGRPGRVASPKIKALIDALNTKLRAEAGTPHVTSGPISLLASFVPRDKAETQSDFGIHLARHYKHMLDYIFVGDTVQQRAALKDALESRARLDQIGIAAARGPLPTLGADTFDFLAIVEDDLVLAPDFVKYFQQMSRVMRVDESIYCVAAHQDNAFLATSAEEIPAVGESLDAQQFAFRRGNHFMAPGWMTSRSMYVDIVRPKWLDAAGEYAFKEELHLRNGHWDRFFDSLIGQRDCIFPEVPRIIHEGADGFTVSKKGQMELYSNLRLSVLDPTTSDYGDLSRLTHVGYRAQQEEFIASAIVLSVAEEAVRYRDQRLVMMVPARDDKDSEWNSVLNSFFGLIGVGGYGGFEGYVKVRGIFRGAVFVRWSSNIILLVGSYSPYAELVGTPTREWGLVLKPEGCVRLPAPIGRGPPLFQQDVAHYTRASISPESCLLSCIHLGYEFAGVTSALNGARCQCASTRGGGSGGSGGGGSFASALTAAIVEPAMCNEVCLGHDAHSTIRSTITHGVKAVLGNSKPCGGGGGAYASVYSADTSADKGHETTAEHLALAAALSPMAPGLALIPPPDAAYVAGGEGQSCTDACAAQGHTCAESLFPLIHRSCVGLQRLMQCSRCEEEDDIERGFATPGRRSRSSDVCTLARGKYIQCSRQPADGYLRACVCKRTGDNSDL